MLCFPPVGFLFVIILEPCYAAGPALFFSQTTCQPSARGEFLSDTCLVPFGGLKPLRLLHTVSFEHSSSLHTPLPNALSPLATAEADLCLQLQASFATLFSHLGWFSCLFLFVQRPVTS